ncbi:MAG: NAD(P)H-binding protein, partial [Pseudomonadota bacterium]
MASTILILGANGRLGQVAVTEFAAAGWTVLAQARRPLRNLPAGAQSVVVDAMDGAALIAAAKGVDVVLNTLNPKYTEWKTLMKPLCANAIAAAEANGAHLLFPGNIYNYGESMPEVLREDTPVAATAGKDKVRMEVEAMLQAASKRGVAVTVLRGGDYFGGPGRGSWFDLNVVSSLAKGTMVYPSDADTIHAWAYLPDFARAMVALANQRAQLHGFQSFNFAGHTFTGAELADTFNQVLTRPVKLKTMPRGVL